MVRRFKRVLLLVLSVAISSFFFVSYSANETASQTMLVFDSQAVPTGANAGSSGTRSGSAGSPSPSSTITSSSPKSSSKSKPSASSSSTSTSPSRQTGSSSGSAKASSSGTSLGHSGKSLQPGQSSEPISSSSNRASSADAPSQPPIEQENPIREINEEIDRITNAQSFEVKIENDFDGLTSFVQQGYAKYAVTNGIGRYYVELHRGNTAEYTYCDGTQLCLATQVGLSGIFPKQPTAAEPSDKHLMLVLPLLQGSESCHAVPSTDGCNTLSVEIPDNLLNNYRGVFMIVNSILSDNLSNKINSLKLEFTLSPQGSLIDLKQHFELDYLGSPLTLDLDRQFEGINQTIVNKPDFL